MLINMSIEKLLSLCAITATVWILYVLLRAAASPLRSIPGPLLARFSRLWYFNRVRKGQFEWDNINLHRKYGPFVRIAPGWYSVDLPEAASQIYSIGSKMPKSDWYDAWKHPTQDRGSMFADRNMKRHADTRRRFQAVYSMSNLVGYEAYVDQCAELLQKRFRERCQGEEEISLVHWMQCYAFDVIGDITYSKRVGFLDKGEDIGGLMAALQRVFTYSSLAGIYVWIHPFLFTIMEKLSLGGAAGRAYLMKFVGASVEERQLERKANTETENNDGPTDFLNKLLKQHEENPEKVTMYHVVAMGLANINAGSDTTAISLAAIMYYLIRSPNVLDRLRTEVDENLPDHDFLQGQALSFRQTRDMPYLQAVMKEALRMHSATGLPLWREVPAGGMAIGGYFFPEGSVLGLNTWCAHYNETVFGVDCMEFRPERWLEADEEKLKRMNSYYLPVSLPIYAHMKFTNALRSSISLTSISY